MMLPTEIMHLASLFPFGPSEGELPSCTKDEIMAFLPTPENAWSICDVFFSHGDWLYNLPILNFFNFITNDMPSCIGLTPSVAVNLWTKCILMFITSRLSLFPLTSFLFFLWFWLSELYLTSQNPMIFGVPSPIINSGRRRSVWSRSSKQLQFQRSKH